MPEPLDLDQLDRLLDEVCARLSEAAGAADGVGVEGAKRFKRILADALVRIFDARDIIFAVRPDLRPELFREAEDDPTAYAAFRDVSLLALRLASEGDPGQAIGILSSFANSTQSTYFALAARKRLAEIKGET